MANADATGETQDLPSESHLIDVLKDSIQEVFSMMMSSVEEATLHRDDRDSVQVRTADGQVETADMGIEAKIVFEGGLNGVVVIRCSDQGALNVAQMLLMTEGEDVLAQEEIDDALGECLNMIAGSLKTKALDPVDDFQLGLPEINASVTEQSDYRAGSLAYRLTDGFLAAEIWLTGEAG